MTKCMADCTGGLSVYVEIIFDHNKNTFVKINCFEIEIDSVLCDPHFRYDNG